MINIPGLNEQEYTAKRKNALREIRGADKFIYQMSDHEFNDARIQYHTFFKELLNFNAYNTLNLLFKKATQTIATVTTGDGYLFVEFFANHRNINFLRFQDAQQDFGVWITACEPYMNSNIYKVTVRCSHTKEELTNKI